MEDLFPEDRLPTDRTWQVAEIERELRMRDQVYPRLIAQGKLSQRDADHRIAVLNAVHERLMKPAPHRVTIRACRAGGHVHFRLFLAGAGVCDKTLCLRLNEFTWFADALSATVEWQSEIY